MLRNNVLFPLTHASNTATPARINHFFRNLTDKQEICVTKQRSAKNSIPMESITDCSPIYLNLASSLKSEKWFTKHWTAVAGLCPNDKEPKSIAIQVFKDTWFNEDGRGIHLESWMTNADVRRGTCNMVLHIESSKERTGINGKALVKALFAIEREKIAAWEGYQTKESYTMQPFIRKMSITQDTLHDQLLSEFRRLSTIADSIDEAIIESKK